MIRHIVAFSAKDPAEIGMIQEALKRLGEIPGVRDFHVAPNAKRDSLSTEMDVVLEATFDTWADLEAYKAHPIYQDTIAVVRPRREQRMVLDYEI
jgi:hypothetical protein